MSQLRTTAIRAGLEALYRTGAHHLLRPIFAGVGAIFMLHHVRPGRDAEFQPNRHLEVEPSFLRKMLAHLRARDVDIITMDEAHRRLDARDFSRRFACFTLDDGFRDNRDHALPVLREFDAPCIVYAVSDFAAGTGRLWWVALERVVAGTAAIEVEMNGRKTHLRPRRRRRRTPPSINCTTGCAHCRTSTTWRARCRRCAPATASTRPRSPASSVCHGMS